ncbi:cysteine peptidase family C39 domain-containing protein [Pedobacter xixiisoli]|uniref:Peptidase C39 family protein n=1 Tax=Pedobacter xixiisoli TaxID=1476464 RepID=A0A286ACY3_9SPHI|nr:cysteine peptidase family C39 domain-containing protein [Pedobacter xixiisoli]SOD19770.1 Peptidase C39 family protein [Pedobacter xixiisoli]
MKVNHVYQHDDTGCGIACVAMIVNQTYFQVKEILKQAGFFDNDDYLGTDFKDMNKALNIFNFSSASKRKFKKWNNIPAKIAIASTNYDSEGGWHWVLFVRDIEGCFIYDPGKRKKKIRDLRGKRSGWFIEII